MFRFLLLLSLHILISASYAQQTVGALQNDSSAFNGYTLIAPEYTSTYLIDNCGHVVNEWESEYPPGKSAYLLENGDLLRVAVIPGIFNAGGLGGRIERYDWDGNLIWHYDYATFDFHQHHDIELLPNGNILLLVWDQRTAMEAINAGRNPDLTSAQGVWSEKIVEIQPEGSDGGTVVWEWDLWDHLVQDFDSTKANFGAVEAQVGRVDINFNANGGGGTSSGPDWVHLNAIDYHPELDQIIVSSRHLHEFWIIDHSTSSQEAASESGGNANQGGAILYRWGNPQAYRKGTAVNQKLFGPHDAHWIPEGLTDAGKIMVFNNGWKRPEEEFSSIEVLQLPQQGAFNYALETGFAYGPDAADWQYTSNPPEDFFSSNVSGAQRLPNGNTLICSGRPGYLFEISDNDSIVWRYQNPVRLSTGPLAQETDIFNEPLVLFRAYRYGPDYPAFTGRDLVAGNPIEVNPIDYGCQLFDLPTAVSDAVAQKPARLLQNPVYDQISLVHTSDEVLTVEVYNSAGALCLRFESARGANKQDFSFWPPGFYVLRIVERPSWPNYVLPFIKL